MSGVLSSQHNLNDFKENLRRLQEQQVQLKMEIESCRQKNDPADALAILEAKAECIQVSINVLQANIKNAEDDIAKEEQPDEVNVFDKVSDIVGSPSAPTRQVPAAPAVPSQTPQSQQGGGETKEHSLVVATPQGNSSMTDDMRMWSTGTKLEHLRLKEKVLEADRALAEGKLEMQILCSELQKVKHLLKLQKAEASKKKSKCRLLRVRAKNLSRSISLSISAIRALEIEKDEAELIAANARAAAIRQADLQKQFDHLKNAEDDIAKEEQADEVNVVDFSMVLNSPSAPLRPDKTAPAQTPQTPGEQKSICTELCNELHNELKKMHIEQMNMLQKIHQDTHQKHLKQQDLALKLAKEAKEHRTAIAKEAK